MSFSPDPACGPSAASSFVVTPTTDTATLKLFYTANGLGSSTGSDGLIKPGFDGAGKYNPTTSSWTDADAYIGEIKSDGVTGTIAGRLLANEASAPTPNISTTQVQMTNDTALLGHIKKEYCFYSTRYQAYIANYLAAKTDVDLAVKYLELAKDYNSKLNALTGLVDHIANTRAGYVNARTTAFNELNNQIQQMVTTGYAPTSFVAENSVLNTRKEMLRYTKEKNNSITNHISLWAALNVVAIAMIFTLYRKM
jgi:hypothetical protein